MDQYDRLFEAVRRSRRSLERFRVNRADAVRAYAGHRWSEDVGVDPVVVNLLGLYVQTVGRTLISQNPRLLLSTPERQYKSSVRKMRDWANKQIVRMEMAETFERAVIDALFSIGICKVALATPAESAAGSWGVQAGEPYAEIVDLDDFAFDVGAKRWSECGWIGHRYRVPLDAVRDDPMYAAGRKKLTPSPLRKINDQGDERVSGLGRTDHLLEEDFEDMVDLWEIYLPRHRKVLTFAGDQITGTIEIGDEPLREQEWIGPYCGPYHILGFGVVPGNAMPKAPIQDLLFLHDKFNSLWRKLIRQAERQKEVGLTVNETDAVRLRDATDGQIIPVQSVDSTSFMESGGPNQRNFGIATSIYDQFNKQGGNLELLAGSGPQSKTATQDKMLNENASRSIMDMQNRTERFVGSVYRALLWYWWHDPIKSMKTTFAIEGMPSISVSSRLDPEKRASIPFEELEIRVDPYSLRNKTPEQRMQQLQSLVVEVYMPMAEQAAAQGIQLDWNAFFEKAAQFYDEPDLSDLLTIRDPPKTESGVGPSHDRKNPIKTQRSYERVNRSEQTREASDRNLVSSLMGVDTGGMQEEQQ